MSKNSSQDQSLNEQDHDCNSEIFTQFSDQSIALDKNLFPSNSAHSKELKIESEDDLLSEISHIEINPHEYSESIKKIVDKNIIASIACRIKNNNPNFLSIIYSNKIFQKIFYLEQSDIISKSFDFLFEDIDLSYSSVDQVEYTQLINAIKNFKAHIAIISLHNFENPQQKIRFKITLIPQLINNISEKYFIINFEVIDFQTNLNLNPSRNNSALLLNNLERSLRNERLLREISGLIISDAEIDKIAGSIAKILCINLKCDRCIIHDYLDNKVNFAVEYANSFSPKVINNKSSINNSTELADYISFQNNFYYRFGDKSKKTTITIVDDIIHDHNFSNLRQFFEKYFVVNQIAITMIFNQKIIGNIFIHQSDKRTWLDDEIEMLEVIANQFGVAISRYFSIQKVMIANQQLIEKSQQLQDALNHEQEMRKMQNEFIALVSHEFKTPLQIIDSTRENVTRKIKNLNLNDESVNKGLERIKTGVERMNGLINSTLNLAKMENSEGKIEVNLSIVNLKKLLDDNIEKSRNMAQSRNIEIINLIDDNIADITSDTMLLEHIFNNLISNAIKYSNNNSKVEISTISSDKNIAIKVRDYGIGIPANDLKKIGTKFFRAENSIAVAGTGIGIYLTKNFIELLKGKFNISSNENSGTLVEVILPK